MQGGRVGAGWEQAGQSGRHRAGEEGNPRSQVAAQQSPFHSNHPQLLPAAPILTCAFGAAGSGAACPARR
jgi:hypothetical protein